MVGRRLKDLWARFTGEENKDSFVGMTTMNEQRVIITVLAFLTIFSLKSLGLLGLLLLINVSGAVSKIAFALSGKHDTKTWNQPQNVHFHIHKENEGDSHIGHTGSGWDDRMGSEDISNLETYNLYNKLSGNILRNYRDTDI
ncbi:hypothetical protein NQ314_007454 [Rhamnusium bicolor]|uniref:Uncharacterized protein n=1 Tax=Rhamnusium bicolor TaxID=1586634 RepID=A0AAV8YQD7_9CUCU|nr:hypothetical protein NQ314_007454 [Rhamnusium bicolor]